MLLAILHIKPLPYKEYHLRHGERHLPYTEMSKTRLFHVNKMVTRTNKTTIMFDIQLIFILKVLIIALNILLV